MMLKSYMELMAHILGSTVPGPLVTELNWFLGQTQLSSQKDSLLTTTGTVSY